MSVIFLKDQSILVTFFTVTANWTSRKQNVHYAGNIAFKMRNEPHHHGKQNLSIRVRKNSTDWVRKVLAW